MKWHKGSRFWMWFPYLILLATALSLYFDTPEVFTTTIGVLGIGAGAKSTVDQYNQRPTPEDK